MAKVNRSFRFSEEVDFVLKSKGNATQYLEDLILGKLEDERSVVNEIKFQADRIIEELKNKSLAPQGVPQGVPQVENIKVNSDGTLSPEDPSESSWVEVGKREAPSCCLNKSPCRHWIWDGLKEGYTNSITGEFRNVV